MRSCYTARGESCQRRSESESEPEQVTLVRKYRGVGDERKTRACAPIAKDVAIEQFFPSGCVGNRRTTAGLPSRNTVRLASRHGRRTSELEAGVVSSARLE